ncbi:MAG: diguanylate cyclase [Myxococcota bacterium]
MGLRSKLAIGTFALIGLGFVVYSTFTLRYERSIYLSESEERSIATLQALSVPTAVAIANRNFPALDNYVSQFAAAAARLELAELAVLDSSGKVLAHTDIGEYAQLQDDALAQAGLASDEPISRTVERDGKTFLEVTVPIENGLRWGTLRGTFGLSRMETTIARNRSSLLFFAGGLALALMVGAIAFLAAFIVRPLEEVRNTARRLGRGDLTARSHLAQRDEIGELSEVFDSMAQQLEHYTHNLEEQVAARTRELRQANDELLDANRKLDALATTDPLTGLQNRRKFFAELSNARNRCDRLGSSMAVILLDIDHFKSFNDQNGHPAGDALLTELAELLKANVRAVDSVGRYGGEEFIVLVQDVTEAVEVRRVAEKIRAAIETHPFAHEETQPGGRVTASCGAALYPSDAASESELVHCADQALYRSKEAGRNRVTLYHARSLHILGVR